MGFENSAVGRNGVACFKENDISDNNILALENNNLAVTQNLRRCRCHLHESVHRSLRLALLNETHYRVNDNNNKDNKNVGKLTNRRLSAGFNNCHNALNGCRNKKHDNHRIGKRVNKFSEQAFLFGFLEFVLTVFLKSFCRFGRA